MIKKLIGYFLFLSFVIFFVSCQKYRQIEEIYQSDADIIRIQHFDYYAKLLTEYYEQNGKYPFQYEKDEQVYIFILNNIQESKFKDTNPYIHYTVDDKWFFEELSNGLGREIDEKYDPQKVAADARPNYYVYMVDNDYMYFAIHLYYSNPFTKTISEYYNKMELSNTDSEEYKLYTYSTLKNSLQYNELVNRRAEKQKYFDELGIEFINDSRK
jgi:hypothetical protein